MNPTIHFTVMNVVIAILIGALVYWTKNPLAILGLFFLQQIPVIVDQGVGEEEELEDADGAGIGFHAKV